MKDVRLYRNGERLAKSVVLNRPIKDISDNVSEIAEAINDMRNNSGLVTLIDGAPIIGQDNVFTITNYDSFSSYTLSVSVGTVARVGDQVTWTIPSSALVGTLVNLKITRIGLTTTFPFTLTN